MKLEMCCAFLGIGMVLMNTCFQDADFYSTQKKFF